MKLRDARGQALLETILLGLLFLVPLVWMLGLVGEMQRAALATSAGAREAASDAARASTTASARARIESAVEIALSDQGLEPERARIAVSGTRGFIRGGSIRITVAYPVRVATIPWLGSIADPVIWVRTESASLIEPYRSRP